MGIEINIFCKRAAPPSEVTAYPYDKHWVDLIGFL